MKKLNFVFPFAIIMALFVSRANAQKGMNIGIIALPQTTWMINSDDADNPGFEYRTTFSAAFGIALGYNFTDNIGIGANVLYSMQGQQYNSLGKKFDQRNDYLKIPLMVNFNSDPSKGVMFMGKIGPQLGLLTSSRLTDGDGNDIIEDTRDRFEDLNIGAVLGAGIGFKLSDALLLTTGMRFDLAFTNAENVGHELYPASRADTYNAVGGLEVGLKYYIK